MLVNGQKVDKAGARVDPDCPIELLGQRKYVSRGGLKLEAALDRFGIDPAGRVCLDVGASTGGFTDCLLARGAARVYAVDTGAGQIHWKLRTDPRVRSAGKHQCPVSDSRRISANPSAWRYAT